MAFVAETVSSGFIFVDGGRYLFTYAMMTQSSFEYVEEVVDLSTGKNLNNLTLFSEVLALLPRSLYLYGVCLIADQGDIYIASKTSELDETQLKFVCDMFCNWIVKFAQKRA
jgi:hypothetical protein